MELTTERLGIQCNFQGGGGGGAGRGVLRYIFKLSVRCE